MRASTERTLMTLFTLGILGVGAWWVWRNVLPAIARGLKTTPTPSPIPSVGTPTPDSPFFSDTVKSMAEGLSFALRNNLSGPGTKVLIDQAKEGVSPATTRLGVSLDEYLAAAKILAGHKIPGYEPFVSPFGIEHTADLSRAYPGGLLQ